MTPSKPLNLAMTMSTAPELFVHSGDGRKTLAMARQHEVGPVIWRGAAGTTMLGNNTVDPLTGAPAWIELGGADRGATPADEDERALRLRGAEIAVVFAPALLVNRTGLPDLEYWLNHEMPRRRSLLAAAGLRGDVVPVVSFYENWLIDPELRAHAIRLLAAVPGPVALYLAAVTNPMHSSAAVVGALDIVRSAGNVIVLRSDEAAIGLVANGALFASVGTSSSSRFTYLGSSSKGPRRDPHHAVFHIPTLSWIDSDRLQAFAVRQRVYRDCPCRICDGRSIIRFQDPAFEIESIAHSMASLQLVYAQVQSATNPAIAWIEECFDAEETAGRIISALPQFDYLGASARAWTAAVLPAS